jgi:hypothetical protein
MKWVFIGLFILGCLFSIAGYGAETGRQRRIYWAIAGIIWVSLLILGITVL